LPSSGLKFAPAQLSGADVVMWGQFVKVGDEIRMDASLRDVKHQRTIPLKADLMFSWMTFYGREGRLGVWGTALFSDDVACDVRDHYRELLEDGVDDDAATQLTIERFRTYLEESDGVALLALAVTQSKLGRLDPGIRDQALAVLDRGADLEMWEHDNPKLLRKRRATLEQARAQLTGEQPIRRRVRPPKRISSGLAAGDVLALALPQRVTLLRVVRVLSHRLGETPILEELDFEGAQVPSREALEHLSGKDADPIALVDALSPDTKFFAFVMQRIDWQRAGFRKVQTINARAGDDQVPLPSAGISWAVLADRYRRRSAP
jgi:hypothetical protein